MDDDIDIALDDWAEDVLSGVQEDFWDAEEYHANQFRKLLDDWEYDEE